MGSGGTDVNTESTMMANVAQLWDYFGTSVSLSSDGNSALVGAPTEEVDGDETGHVYFFIRSPGTFGPSVWQQMQIIQPDDSQIDDRFGWSVSMSTDGNTAIVGAYHKNPVTPGAAYIFTRSGDTWTQQEKIIASDAEVSAKFGLATSISSDGNTAVVGASRTSPSDTGAAYIFTRSGSAWTEQQKIVGSAVIEGDQFGDFVSISDDGNTVVSASSKSAYVFARPADVTTPGVWAEEGAMEEGGYIQSVSISATGDNIVVGNTDIENTNGDLSGVALIYTRSGTTWQLQQQVEASNGVVNDQFGMSAGMSAAGDTIIIGAAYSTEVTYSGKVYIFTRTGSLWTQAKEILHSNLQDNDQFGYSVDMSADGSQIIVGALGEDPGIGYVTTYTI